MDGHDCTSDATDRDRLSSCAPVFFPGGVADPAERAGYVADGGEIVAVELAAGRPLWRTDAASRPLVVFGDRLAAAVPLADRSNVLQIVVLDLTRQGESMLASDPVVFPEWVSVANRASFGCTAHVEGGRLLLDWEAHARYGGGAAPPAQISRQSTKSTAGTFAVDLAAGNVGSLPGAARRRLPLDPEDLTTPWPAGAKLARLVWEVDDGEQSLSLETRDESTQGPATVVELARGHGLVAQVTPDGRFLFVHEAQAPSCDERWSVFSAETGRRMATLNYERGAHSPAILGPTAYYMVEGTVGAADVLQLTLTARALDTDTLSWRLALGERRVVEAPRLRQ